MISRKSAFLIAEAYFEKFQSSYQTHVRSSSSKYILLRDEFYDFLFNEGYEAWFLNLAQKVDKFSERSLREFLMRLHTGETAYIATVDWTWEDRQKLGQRYLKDLAEDILNSPVKLSGRFNTAVAVPSIDRMRAQLELDGYIFRDGALYETESSVINEESEQNYLAQLVNQLGLAEPTVVLHHMELAEEHYAKGKWDDSVGNSRKFLEAILARSAARYAKAKGLPELGIQVLTSPRDVRDTLQRDGLLEGKEKDALAKVYGLLSETGGHPYIAAKDQARLMWHLALTFSQFVLLRLEGYLTSHPLTP